MASIYSNQQTRVWKNSKTVKGKVDEQFVPCEAGTKVYFFDTQEIILHIMT